VKGTLHLGGGGDTEAHAESHERKSCEYRATYSHDSDPFVRRNLVAWNGERVFDPETDELSTALAAVRSLYNCAACNVEPG
jgi:hypothetical protein